ncbi:Atg6/Beclin, partial [Cantharellus anzutake]|uniref:Atg6/Beclin n=1 Tax=Cantharellus anzutake TaxID=1750568 RepID=UPI001905FAC5
LFNLLNSHTSSITHPLCTECTTTLLENLEKKLEETRRERDGYLAFERDVRRKRDAILAAGEDGDGEEKRLELEAEASKAVAELRATEHEKRQLEAELAALEEEEKALEEEESEFWANHSQTTLLHARASDTVASLNAAISQTQRDLASLARTNVYNDAFCIGHDGHGIGTVNGLRLGRVSGVNVEWAEINAAWGWTLLLLYTIAKKVGVEFETYRLVPMGSTSRIEKITGDKATYELYGSGDVHLTRLLHNRRFDYAMVAFLDCLRQMMEHVNSVDPSVEFPHAIVKDKIGEASIKLQFNQEEVWTRAMRHVLLALKLLLKWATSG